MDADRANNVSEAIEAIRAMCEAISSEDLSSDDLKQMIEEGRRF